MAGTWDKLVARDSRYLVEDYERAAYRLISHQVLSAMDKGTRKDYHLVADNLREYLQVMEPMGVSIRHDAQYQYVVAQPRHVLNQRRVSKQVTLLVLVLASVHHQVRFNGMEGDFGEAYVELPALQEAYQEMTGQDFPKTTEFRTSLGELERWGIARQEDIRFDEGQPFRVLIHPAISAIVTKEWLTLLDGFRKVTELSEDVVDNEGEPENSDVSA
jgi:hypothetical protein